MLNTVLKIAHLMSGGAGHQNPDESDSKSVLCAICALSLDLTLVYKMDLSIPKEKKLKLLACFKRLTLWYLLHVSWNQGSL